MESETGMTAATDMDQVASTTQQWFVRQRDELLALKEGQTARSLATELVSLMELLAVHGSTGIGADPDARQAYVDTLTARIDSVITLPRPTADV